MPDSFLTQLRNRKTLRVAAGYLAATFVLLQAADLLLSALAGPPRLLGWLVGLAALGFPVALFVGWYVRWTGERLEWETTKASRQQHLLFACVVLVSTGAVGFTSWGVWLRGGSAAREESESTALNPSRIAVLYLDDHTPGGAKSFLADGLTEGLIHELSRVRALEVVSRNGVKPFRNASLPLDSVVGALRSGHIVEGSVQESGNRIRVTVQLIDGATLAHVGSTTVERSFNELFALQDTILIEVSRFLRLRLGDQIRLATVRQRTSSVEAWTLYHRALRLRDEAVSVAASNTDAASSYFGEASALATAAERADARWSAPAKLRARIAYDESRALVSTDTDRTVALIYQAITHAQRAVRFDSLDAEAFELRGTATYWGYLVGIWQDSAETMLARAAADLQHAVKLDPDLAAAWATLSHYYANAAGAQQAYDAALRAYEADAFLENAATVLWRLYTFTHDLRKVSQAAQWCDEGRRRFPENFRFTECRLWQFTLPAVKPDPEAAWKYYGEYIERISGGRARADSLRMLAVVGITLGRAGLTDSARAVLKRVQISWEDPLERDIGIDRAIGHVVIGDYEEAADFSHRYLSTVPNAAAGFYENEWFQQAKNHPAFQRVNRLLDSISR